MAGTNNPIVIPMVQSQDRLLNSAQNNIAQAVNKSLTAVNQTVSANALAISTLTATQSQIQAAPFINGKFLNAQTLSSGANVINHTLGKVPTGYVITDQTASANIFRSAASTSTTITLTSSAAVTVNLYLF